MSDEDDIHERIPSLRRLRHKKTQSATYWGSKGMEKRVAKDVGGHRTTGSGNKNVKGDVRVRGIARIEHKATQNKSFSITREMVDKISNAALLNDEVPAMVVEFCDVRGKSLHKLAVISYDDLVDLLRK